MILHLIMAFLATISFSFLFNAPRKELSFCGLTGTFGVMIHKIVSAFGYEGVPASFAAALAITFLSRILSIHRKMPSTLFLIAGILPLVPGGGIYGAMYAVVANNGPDAILKGVETLKLAGAIAVGIIVILSLPMGNSIQQKTARPS